MFRIFANFSRPLLALVLMTLLAALGMAQQVKQRGVQYVTYSDQPVEIVAVKVKGVPVKPKQKFDGDSDWLNGMTFTLKNVFDRPVACVSVLVSAYYERDGKRIKQRDGMDVQAAIELVYGIQPTRPGERNISNYSRPMLSGETVDVILSEAKRDELYSLLMADNASTDVIELTARVYTVFFEGDSETKWKTWRMLRRDPNDSEFWIPVKRDTPSSRAHRRPGVAKAQPAALAHAPQ